MKLSGDVPQYRDVLHYYSHHAFPIKLKRLQYTIYYINTNITVHCIIKLVNSGERHPYD